MEDKQLKCLSCGHPVVPTEVKLYYRVFVCSLCYDKTEQFVVSVRRDLRQLEQNIIVAVRHGLLKGALQYYDSESTDVRGRMVKLVEWTKEASCPPHPHSSSIAESTVPMLSSGESTELNAPTPDVGGEKSSSSTTR